jgi:predicted transcriptional regulator of viral defense system
MHQWRANRKLAKLECECGNIPRVAHDKGCARCEALDQQRYARKSTTETVLDALGRFDLISVRDLADALGINHHQAYMALRRLTQTGKAERVGSANSTEYRLGRAA